MKHKIFQTFLRVCSLLSSSDEQNYNIVQNKISQYQKANTRKKKERKKRSIEDESQEPESNYNLFFLVREKSASKLTQHVAGN